MRVLRVPLPRGCRAARAWPEWAPVGRLARLRLRPPPHRALCPPCAPHSHPSQGWQYARCPARTVSLVNTASPVSPASPASPASHVNPASLVNPVSACCPARSPASPASIPRGIHYQNHHHHHHHDHHREQHAATLCRAASSTPGESHHHGGDDAGEEPTRGRHVARRVPHLVVVGGGAAGVFGAIRAKELCGDRLHVTVLEKAQPLSKVRISGGGRCNVTTGLSQDPLFLAGQYPRGHRELKGSFFRRHGPQDTMAWFQDRGVQLKTEGDGRVFPVSDSSQTIIDCLLQEAKGLGVRMRTGWPVGSIRVEQQQDGAETTFKGKDPELLDPSGPEGPLHSERALHAEGSLELNPGGGAGTLGPGRFVVATSKRGAGEGGTLEADFLLLSTGSSEKGYELAQSLGHSLVSPCPSLFTFNIVDPGLHDLAGVSVDGVEASLEVIPEAQPPEAAEAKASGKHRPAGSRGAKSFLQRGPLLVTHWGLSGPVVLRLSAWAAREMHGAQYRGTLAVDFSGGRTGEGVLALLTACKAKHKASKVLSLPPPEMDLPRRMWQFLLQRLTPAPIESLLWADAPKKLLMQMTSQLKRAPFEVSGKGKFKEEFVTAGGVPLTEINLGSMESKVVPNLFLCGEIVNVDGVTGGFNFQNAWTGSHTAGTAIAERATPS